MARTYIIDLVTSELGISKGMYPPNDFLVGANVSFAPIELPLIDCYVEAKTNIYHCKNKKYKKTETLQAIEMME